MYMNGVRTGKEATAAVRRPIRRDLRQALTVWDVAAAGAAMRGTVECRIVTTTFPTTGSATLVSASAFLSINIQSRNCLSKRAERHYGVEHERSGAKREARRNKCREEIFLKLRN